MTVVPKEPHPLACQPDLKTLPATAAQVMSEVIDRVTATWELKRSHLSAELVSDAFNVIGQELFEHTTVPVAQIENLLVRMAVHEWGYAQGLSRNVARELRLFWDEAGVFVATGSPAQVKSPLRSMAEIAAARTLARSTRSDQERWLDDRLNSQHYEIAKLAACLSPDFASLLVRLGSVSESAMALACEAVSSGAHPDAQSLAALITAACALPWDGRSRTWVAKWRAAAAVQDDNQRQQVVEAAKALPQAYRSAVEAVAWSSAPGAWLAGLSSFLSTARRPGAIGGAFPDLAGDREWDEALAMVATRVIPEHPGLAPEVFAAIQNSTLGVNIRIRFLLLRYGHAEMMERAEPSDRLGRTKVGNWARGMSLDDASLVLLQKLGNIASVEVPYGRLRRLRELSQVITTLINPEESAFWPDYVLNDTRGTVDLVLETVLALSGVEVGIVAVQASYVLRSLPVGDWLGSLWDDVAPLDLDRWESIADRGQMRRRLYVWLSSDRWREYLSRVALLHCPDRASMISEVRSLIDSMPPSARAKAADILILSSESARDEVESLLLSPDPMKRLAAGRRISLANDERLATIALLDTDTGVRTATANALGDRLWNSSLAETREAIRLNPAAGWQCDWCGSTAVPNNARECSKCKMQRAGWPSPPEGHAKLGADEIPTIVVGASENE